jgi:hypothetical protein
MWDMIDDITSTTGTGFRYVREIADRALMVESAKTSATEAALRDKDVQVQILVKVKEGVLKDFGVKEERNNIIDFSNIDTNEGEV